MQTASSVTEAVRGANTLEVIVDDARFWQRCIEAVANLIDEGNFEFRPEGIFLKAMDPSQIAMVSFHVPSKSFSEYKVEDVQKLGLNIDNLAKILARVREKEKLKMKLDGKKLWLEFKGQTTRRFKVPLLDLGSGPTKEPKIEYDSVVKINAGQLKEIIRDAQLVSSHLVFETSSEGFFVDASGDVADFRSESEKSAQILAELTVRKPARATFPLQFVDDIAKACPNENQIALNLKTNAPIKIEYSIGDAQLVYYLAPRIEAA